MRGSPSKGRTPESLACDRGPRSSPTGSRPSRGRPHSRRPSAATLQPGPGRGLAGTWASPRPVPARPPRRSQLTRTRSPWHRRPHGRPAPDRGRQTSDTQAEVRPRLSDPQPAVPLAAGRSPRPAPSVSRRLANQRSARRPRRGRNHADHVLRTASPSALSESGSHGGVAARPANHRLEKVGLCRFWS